MSDKNKKSFKNKDKVVFSLFFIIILASIIFTLFFFNIFEVFESKILDFRFLFFNQNKTPSKEVVFIDIDEQSLQEISPKFGTWPWPRGGVISLKIIDYIMEGNPSSFLFDILMTEYYPKLPTETFSVEDAVLLDASIYYPNVSHAVFFQEVIEEETPTANRGLPMSTDYNFMVEVDDSESKIKFQKFNDYLIPFDPLYFNANSLHSVNHKEDIDGISRKSMILVKYKDKYYPSLVLKGLIFKLGITKIKITNTSLIMTSSDGKEYKIDTNENGEYQMNFYKQTTQFVSYPASAIIASNDLIREGKEPLIYPDEFQDKIVIIGASAIGLHDIKATPLGKIAGPYLHITTISNILENHYLTRASTLVTILSILLSICLIVLSTTFLQSRYIKNIIGLTWIILQIAVTMIVFKRLGLILELATTLTASIFSYFGSLIFLSLTEEKDKRFLKETFGSYLAPELIDDMFNNKTMPELGGESREVTAYFTDIQGFSTFSEKLTAVQLVELLNEYLSAMTDILLEHRGTLDKYEGDAIIAFVGAPMTVPDHAFKACQISIGMQNKLLELREKWVKEKQSEDEPNRNVKTFPPEEWVPGAKWPKIVHDMKMRIGINTGEIVVGNMGSATRMNYTMMGDSVNLAARLEAAAKQYGIYTQISEFTLENEFTNESGEKKKVRDLVEYRYIDKIVVVGKSEPVKVYEVVATKGGLTPKEQELFKIFDEGMKNYLSQNWDKAAELFQKSLKIERVPEGITTPSEVYINRCKHFKANPPKPGWDGRWVLTSK